jgi:hypothetical protein
LVDFWEYLNSEDNVKGYFDEWCLFPTIWIDGSHKLVPFSLAFTVYYVEVDENSYHPTWNTWSRIAEISQKTTTFVGIKMFPFYVIQMVVQTFQSKRVEWTSYSCINKYGSYCQEWEYDSIWGVTWTMWTNRNKSYIFQILCYSDGSTNIPKAFPDFHLLWPDLADVCYHKYHCLGLEVAVWSSNLVMNCDDDLNC